jgi:UDP-N-acetylglucosamine 2-epimerase (non-hydrolysing)
MSHELAPKSVAVVLGTRPEIIKLAHIVRMLGPACLLIHTGQHYDTNLSESFFAELSLPEPHLFLEVGGTARGNQIGEAVRRLDALFADLRPKAVMVQGDTNATMAGAVAANSRQILLCHIEAGLRSHDRSMPEEHNRVVADHLADLCCTPTEVSAHNLESEGITGERVVITGNTVVEAVTDLLPPPAERKELLKRYGVERDRFVLSTFHRPENVDDLRRFEAILLELNALPLPVLLPLHPRSFKRVEEFGLSELLAKLEVTAPIGYRPFLGLEAEAAMIISDSGGVQEEASIVKRPVVVVRNSTERPEVLGTFASRVLPGPSIGEEAGRILSDLEGIHAELATIPSPYGDGSASRRSLEALAARL